MKTPFTVPRQAWFALFGIALLLAFGWVATRSGPLAPVKVTVTKVVKGDVAPSLFGIGTVEARRAFLIGPTAAGRVRRVLVDVGDRVVAGQLLAEMDPVDLDARVGSAAKPGTRPNPYSPRQMATTCWRYPVRTSANWSVTFCGSASRLKCWGLPTCEAG